MLGLRASLGEVVRPESGAQGTSLGGTRGVSSLVRITKANRGVCESSEGPFSTETSE